MFSGFEGHPLRPSCHRVEIFSLYANVCVLYSVVGYMFMPLKFIQPVVCVTTLNLFFQGKYGGCFPNAYNANKRAWYMSCAADWWMLFLLHENQQCLHRDCSQQQCECSLCLQVCCWGNEDVVILNFCRFCIVCT